MTPIRVSVSYGLGEYMSIVLEYCAWHKRETERSRRTSASRNDSLGWIGRFVIYLVAPPIFLFKKLSVGRCAFVIDASGIERHSRSGFIFLDWGEVERVHFFSRAYLIEKTKGAVPLPHRVMRPDQRNDFEKILQCRGVPILGEHRDQGLI